MKFILIILAVFFIGMIFYGKSRGNKTVVKKYKSKMLMTDNEVEFFGRLTSALPECHVFSQVSMGALLQPNVTRNDKSFMGIRGTFAQKISDYVICDKFLSVIAVVELDDKTHNKEQDRKRDSMLSQADYKVIRWESKNKPSNKQIHDAIFPFLASSDLIPT